MEQADREREWALASARAEGVSIRELARAVGLSPTRVHQIVTSADPDELDTMLTGLRTAGWPAPEDPDGEEDAELDGRGLVADRIGDEVASLRTCAGWLVQLETGRYPPAVNLRPAEDWPETANVMVTPARVAAALQRIAADLDELARARRISDLQGASVRPDRRAERRRRLAEPDLGVPRLLHPAAAARLLRAGRRCAGIGRIAPAGPAGSGDVGGAHWVHGHGSSRDLFHRLIISRVVPGPCHPPLYGVFALSARITLISDIPGFARDDPHPRGRSEPR